MRVIFFLVNRLNAMNYQQHNHSVPYSAELIQQDCKHGYRKYHEDTQYCNINYGPTDTLTLTSAGSEYLQKKREPTTKLVNCPLRPYMGHSNQKLFIPDLHSNSSSSATLFNFRTLLHPYTLSSVTVTPLISHIMAE